MFDFVRNIGRKPEVEAQEERLSDLDLAIDLKQYARKLDLAVDDVSYAVSDGTATITGTVPSQAEKEKVVLAAGNTTGIGQVDDQLDIAAAEKPVSASGEAAADALVAKMKREAQMKAAASEAPVAAQMAAQSRFYTVKSGDTLWKIAEEMLGAGNRYPEIFEANKPMLTDPDLIYPDQVLRIPS